MRPRRVFSTISRLRFQRPLTRHRHRTSAISSGRACGRAPRRRLGVDGALMTRPFALWSLVPVVAFWVEIGVISVLPFESLLVLLIAFSPLRDPFNRTEHFVAAGRAGSHGGGVDDVGPASTAEHAQAVSRRPNRWPKRRPGSIPPHGVPGDDRPATPVWRRPSAIGIGRRSASSVRRRPPARRISSGFVSLARLSDTNEACSIVSTALGQQP
jgi:hypothetical protein